MNGDDSDRRRNQRVGLRAYAALEVTGVHANNQAFATVANISRTGIALDIAQPPEVGSPVLLRLAIGEEIHEVRAVVKRIEQKARNHYIVGLDWSKCSNRDMSFVDRCIEECEPVKQ